MLILLKTLVVTLFGSVLNQAVASQITLVDQLHQAYNQVVYFEADFTQKKHIKFLSKPLVSKGKIKFAKEQGMIWEITDPVWVKTKIQDNQIFKTTSYQTNKQVTDVQMKAVAQILTELLSSKLDRVESQFDVSALQMDETNGVWQVRLKPKTVMIKKALHELLITGQVADDFDQQGISHIKVIDNNGNQTDIAFESVHIETGTLTQEVLDAFQ